MTEPILLSDHTALMQLLHPDYPTKVGAIDSSYEDHLLRVATHLRDQIASALDVAEDHVLGENDHEWALLANGSHVSYPTIAEAFDAARDDFDLPARGSSVHE